ncbi:MAG: trypsin-like peptidase domain-containing protein [Firmicutes bacterium]|nr:trypsin-like peptidase domain-containing protein [Bacillota bacterium]
MKKAITKLAKLVLLGCVMGGMIGFVEPFAKGYVIPKIEESRVAADEAKQNAEQSSETDEKINVQNTVSLDEASKNTVELIKKVKPAVVCITTKATSRDWFNQVYETEGAGSGVIFHQDENNVYIVTNAHVVSGASKVLISVSESDLVSASLVGKDTNADLAVISVTKADLNAVGITGVTVAEFGSSSTLQMGESVIAIGNALGHGNTATAGIVSTLPKEVTIQGKKLTVVQTDAAINPGNSGGALINSKGQVIGINTAKLAVTEVEGVGYAIASDVAKPMIESLMNTSETPALGVSVVDITETEAKYYGLPQAGVVIGQVYKGSAAESAGLESGDIVTAFNDVPVFTSDQLINTIKKCKVGDSVSVTIIRDGKTEKKTAKLTKAQTGF